MPEGTTVVRSCVNVTNEGQIFIDWGLGAMQQDVITGEFFELDPRLYTYPITDAELDDLVRATLVSAYDATCVYFVALPEKQQA